MPLVLNVAPSLPLERSACFLAELQLGTRVTWAHLLEQAREEWEQQHTALTQVRLTLATSLRTAGSLCCDGLQPAVRAELGPEWIQEIMDPDE